MSTLLFHDPLLDKPSGLLRLAHFCGYKFGRGNQGLISKHADPDEIMDSENNPTASHP
jgi:hypothetical protein